MINHEVLLMTFPKVMKYSKVDDFFDSIPFKSRIDLMAEAFIVATLRWKTNSQLYIFRTHILTRYSQWSSSPSWWLYNLFGRNKRKTEQQPVFRNRPVAKGQLRHPQVALHGAVGIYFWDEKKLQQEAIESSFQTWDWSACPGNLR